ncbi:MAG: ROK family protein [Pseudomonadota bacterium]
MSEHRRSDEPGIRIGFDIGGTKLAVVALDRKGAELGRDRRPVPRDYRGVVDAIVHMAGSMADAHGDALSLGIALPGMIGAKSELVRMVNLPWLERTPLREDLQQALARPVAIANDANCFALSEAQDGAAAGAGVVFGVILGTGVGGGIVVHGRVVAGANAIAGEWGHNPLFEIGETTGPPVTCGCGRIGCIETWLNGAALTRDYLALSGTELDAAEVAVRAEAGEDAARTALSRFEHRLAAALASIINILDPDVIVLGGGLASIASLYESVPRRWSEFCVASKPKTRLARARFGPESGLRGAAWLGATASGENA